MSKFNLQVDRQVRQLDPQIQGVPPDPCSREPVCISATELDRSEDEDSRVRMGGL